MGADFILAYVEFEDDADLVKAEKDMLAHLETMNGTEEGWGNYDETMTGDNTNTPFPELKGYAENTIKEFFTSLNSREVTYLIVYDRRIFITGGMSYGDSPTDAERYFNEFVNLPPELLLAGNAETDKDVFKLFMKTYEKELPKHIKESLIAWQVAKKI